MGGTVVELLEDTCLYHLSVMEDNLATRSRRVVSPDVYLEPDLVVSFDVVRGNQLDSDFADRRDVPADQFNGRLALVGVKELVDAQEVEDVLDTVKLRR